MTDLHPIKGSDYYQRDYDDVIYQLNISASSTQHERTMIASVIRDDAARDGYEIKSLERFVHFLCRKAGELGR